MSASLAMLRGKRDSSLCHPGLELSRGNHVLQAWVQLWYPESLLQKPSEQEFWGTEWRLLSLRLSLITPWRCLIFDNEGNHSLTIAITYNHFLQARPIAVMLLEISNSTGRKELINASNVLIWPQI